MQEQYGLTARQAGEIAAELHSVLKLEALKPPAIEIVPFEKEVDAYSRMAAGLSKTKEVLDFPFGD